MSFLPALPDLLRLAGINVSEVAGWQTRASNSSRPFTPVGMIAHHTAGRNSLQLCIDRALVNFLVDKAGTVYLISDGRTGHPGKHNAKAVLEASQDRAPRGNAIDVWGRADSTDPTFDPYRWWWGVEVENMGDNVDPYPLVQLEAAYRLIAAICLMNGWSANRAWHHKEITHRKVDMSTNANVWGKDLRFWVGFYMGKIQAEIAELSAPTDNGNGNAVLPPPAPTVEDQPDAGRGPLPEPPVVVVPPVQPDPPVVAVPPAPAPVPEPVPESDPAPPVKQPNPALRGALTTLIIGVITVGASILELDADAQQIATIAATAASILAGLAAKFIHEISNLEVTNVDD